ncbi:hypothetical protein SSX86_005557 [Deinandra increscens subsp. villosa]|uniref:Uncharacterized protein n=1 Tax=Deinandra increscens subsp. villosa TaxID=3103831 RepID=A0AAP0H9Z0_9ASTR
MEGLIPFLMRAIKKPRPHNNYRTLSASAGSTPSYQVLVGADPKAERSSHRRTRSELHPQTADIMERRPRFGLFFDLLSNFQMGEGKASGSDWKWVSVDNKIPCQSPSRVSPCNVQAMEAVPKRLSPGNGQAMETVPNGIIPVNENPTVEKGM